MTFYLILMYLGSLTLAYVLRFTEATLALGRSLSDVETPTGYQDAITPPRLATIAFAVSTLCLLGIIYGFWRFGWLIGVGIIAGFFGVLMINKLLLLPKENSEHFRRIIVHSLINRHADYLKEGDALRASAVAMLLEKLGIPVNQINESLKK
ncbi:MAG: hypothetical protein ABIU05_27185 [Nitrospirales bacterium]